MNPLPLKGNIMQFIGIDNPFGVKAFDPTTYDSIKDAPRSKRTVGQRRSMRLRAPKPPSAHLRKILLTL